MRSISVAGESYLLPEIESAKAVRPAAGLTAGVFTAYILLYESLATFPFPAPAHLSGQGDRL